VNSAQTQSLVFRAVLAYGTGDQAELDRLFSGPDAPLLAEGLLAIALDVFTTRLGGELWQQAAQDLAVVAEAEAILEGVQP
jgi:hypothetical protein